MLGVTSWRASWAKDRKAIILSAAAAVSEEEDDTNLFEDELSIALDRKDSKLDHHDVIIHIQCAATTKRRIAADIAIDRSKNTKLVLLESNSNGSHREDHDPLKNFNTEMEKKHVA